MQAQQWGWAEVLISEHRICDFLTNISAFKFFLHQLRTSYSHSFLSLTGHLCLCLCQTNRVDRLDLREQALAILTNLSTLLVAVPTDIPTLWQQCNEPDLHTLVHKEHTERPDNLIVDNSLPLELNTVTATHLPFPPDCLFTFSEDHPLGWLWVIGLLVGLQTIIYYGNQFFCGGMFSSVSCVCFVFCHDFFFLDVHLLVWQSRLLSLPCCWDEQLRLL